MSKMWKWLAIILAVVLVYMNWDKIKNMVKKDESLNTDGTPNTDNDVSTPL